MAKQLPDYSGPFNPNFNQGQLSRETLGKLLTAYSDYIRKLDGHWYLSVMQKCGNGTAFECDSEVWEEMAAYTIRTTCELLNIRGDDVEAVLKAMQVNPWTLMYKCKIELVNKDHGFITFYDCPTLEALEREGGRRWETICNDLEVRLMDVKAHAINPRIKTNPIKLPPRQPGSELCCRWELKLER